MDNNNMIIIRYIYKYIINITYYTCIYIRTNEASKIYILLYLIIICNKIKSVKIINKHAYI